MSGQNGSQKKDPSEIGGETANEVIVYFDGVCGLCNSLVDFLIRHDGQRNFRYAPLQGEYAKKNLGLKAEQLDTMYVQCEGQLFAKSAAWFILMDRLGGPWRLFKIFKILPTFLLDAMYDSIAANRYRFFGVRSTCRLPSKSELSLFYQ